MRKHFFGQCADNEDPDRPAHPRSPIRAFRSPQAELLDTTECFNGELIPG